MRDNIPATHISSLYSYYIYHNLIQSILSRKQVNADHLVENGSAMISWGPSVFIGGAFSKADGEKLVSALAASDSPRYLYLPDDEWHSFIKNTLSDRLKDRYLNLYQSDNRRLTDPDEDGQCIVRITRSFIAQKLPDTELITDELYSYTDMEDFFQNGFGLALVIDGKVYGYCLSEYSIGNSHGINIWIDERYRRLGYAGKMANAFLSVCREKNQNAYWVCDADNIPSNKTAISSGFILKSTMLYYEL